MPLKNILRIENVLLRLRMSNKPELLQKLCDAAAKATRVDAQTISAAIGEREALGSTGVGDGLALPHARLESLMQPFVLLATLAHPIRFDAIDGQPVDIVVLVLTPKRRENEVNVLACVARALRAATNREIIRRSATPQDVVNLLTDT